MSTVFELTAKVRKDVGKGASRRLRRLEDKVPAIIYGAHQDAATVSLDHNKVIKALQNEAFYSHILTINIEGKKEKVVLKDLHRHPAQPRILHMDFQRVSATEKLHIQAPIHLINEEKCMGVKKGGILSQHLMTVEITCLPADLPESIDIDVLNLDVDGVIHISDLTPPKGVEFSALSHDGHDATVISIHMPRQGAGEDEPTTAPVAAEVEAIKQQPKTDK